MRIAVLLLVGPTGQFRAAFAYGSFACCNAPRSLSPRFPRSFPARFAQSHALSCGPCVMGICRIGIRILAHVGRRGIPVPERQKERPAQKRPGDLRVLEPKASARELHKRMRRALKITGDAVPEHVGPPLSNLQGYSVL